MEYIQEKIFGRNGIRPLKKAPCDYLSDEPSSHPCHRSFACPRGTSRPGWLPTGGYLTLAVHSTFFIPHSSGWHALKYRHKPDVFYLSLWEIASSGTTLKRMRLIIHIRPVSTWMMVCNIVYSRSIALGSYCISSLLVPFSFRFFSVAGFFQALTSRLHVRLWYPCVVKWIGGQHRENQNQNKKMSLAEIKRKMKS